MKPLVTTEKDGHVVVQLPPGLSQEDWLGFRDHMHRQFMDRGIIDLVIDCESSPELPSIAFGSFTSLSRDLRRSGGSLHLVHVSERIRQVLTRTRMDEYLPIRGTLTEVIRRPAQPKPG